MSIETIAKAIKKNKPKELLYSPGWVYFIATDEIVGTINGIPIRKIKPLENSK